MIASMYSLMQFYSQFETPINDYITSKSKSIEKELKNYVKIARWNDVNFWAVKASVDKAHKTVAKHMREYQVRQP